MWKDAKDQRDAEVNSGVYAHTALAETCSVSMSDQRLSVSTREKAFHAFLVIATRSFHMGTGSRRQDLEPLLQKSLIFFSAKGQVRLQSKKNKWDTSPRRPDAGGQWRLPRQQVVAHIMLLT